MRGFARIVSVVVLAGVAGGFVGGCKGPEKSRSSEALSAIVIGQRAHESYVRAINSNDLDTFLAVVTDDVVFLPPNGERVVGKDAVAEWVGGYLGAYKIHWEKTTLEFVVSGEWAFEQYAYQSSETPRAGGATVRDTGKGINIYHHDSDGKWRVARDAWSSDLPASGE